jgi:hypothetical protein
MDEFVIKGGPFFFTSKIDIRLFVSLLALFTDLPSVSIAVERIQISLSWNVKCWRDSANIVTNQVTCALNSSGRTPPSFNLFLPSG